jgi:hypothetical protein
LALATDNMLKYFFEIHVIYESFGYLI